MIYFSSKGSKHRNRLHWGLKNSEVAGTRKHGNCAVILLSKCTVALAGIFQTGASYHTPTRVRHCVWFLKRIPSPRVCKRQVISIFWRSHWGSESSPAIRQNWISLHTDYCLCTAPHIFHSGFRRYRIQCRLHGHSLAPVPSQGQAAYNYAQKWTTDHCNCTKPLAPSKST